MAENQQIGFTLSVKSEQFIRAMKEVEESRKQVDRVFTRSAANKADPLSLERFQRAKVELRAVNREYEAIKKSMDAQFAAGQKIAEQEKQRLRTLEAHKRFIESEVKGSKFSSFGEGVSKGQVKGVTTETVDGRDWGGMIMRGVMGGIRLGIRGAMMLERGTNRVSGMTGGLAGFALGNPMPMVTALSSIPFVGSGLGTVAAAALQQYSLGKPVLMQNLQMASLARGLTGMGGGYLQGAGNFGLSLAFSRAQSLQMLGMYGQAAGRTEGFNTSLMMRRGYGIDSNDLVSSARHMSLETAKSVQLALVRGIESGAFNRALAKEFASASGSLMAQIASAGGAGSANNITALVGLMAQRLGGVYERSPQKLAGVLGGVNQALLGFAGGQGGDAKQAFMFEALRAANPKMSYIDLAMQAEKGVSDPRNLSAVTNMIRRRYQGRKMQALAFSRLTGRSITEGYDIMGMDDISPEEVAHRLVSGAPEQALKRRAREGMKGMGIVQRENYLNEKRAALAAKADPMMAKYANLQMQAVDLLGKVVDKLQELLGVTKAPSAKDKADMKAITDAAEQGRSVGGMGGIGGFVNTLRDRSAAPSRPSPSVK